MFAAAEAEDTDSNCSYQKVLDHLKLTKTNELYSMTRPVKNYQRPTQVSLEVLLYAILDVVSSWSWRSVFSDDEVMRNDINSWKIYSLLLQTGVL